MLAIKHYFNPSKDVIIDIKPLKSHSPFVSWSYNADLDEFTLTVVRKQKMRCSSKTIYKMSHKDIKTLSTLPLNNPSKDPRGYEVERIVSHMQMLQQQIDADRLISSIIFILAADSCVPRRQIVAADYPCQASLKTLCKSD
ncbi:hypothetical protein L1987_74368 [Smallanthus sonchifolius]|uniref:Uncharacterized protein n=1 Tax=Smallanthus sonchifolius TaxID=185202 RepID=A0ACB9A2W0_9ASTR|nr:hypothetical protein L1987_74368 [Smallanthus sonchifolius]